MIKDEDSADTYLIRVRGVLGEGATRTIPGMTVLRSGNGMTVLTGQVIDQAALYGVIRTIRDSGMELLELRKQEITERRWK